jgi:hypothetical protein
MQHCEEIALQVADILRIELLAQRGRAREIGEEHGDNATLVLLARPWPAASIVMQSGSARGAEDGRAELLGSACWTRPVQRRTAPAAEASVDRLVGTARSAHDPHEPSVRRRLSARHRARPIAV